MEQEYQKNRNSALNVATESAKNLKKFDVHQIKIEFNVTEQIKRYVYVFIIEAEHLYMIDSGVYGCKKQIEQYLKQIGRDFNDIRAIFLTHADPDHIGSASWFQEMSVAKYMQVQEKEDGFRILTFNLRKADTEFL